MYKGLHEGLHDLYFPRSVILSVETKKTDFSYAVFRNAMKYLHEQRSFDSSMLGSEPVVMLTNETYKALKKGVDFVINDNSVPKSMIDKLNEDIYVFSGCKTYHELKEASLLLRDQKGQIKPFESFRRDIEVIHENYNRNYLEAEYDFAISSAQSAAKWNDFKTSGDDYDLQYRTAGDNHVRADHARLNGTTLPPSHPFWDNYMPPNGWRCRCQVLQVRRGKYASSDGDQALKNGKAATTQIDSKGHNRAEMFRFNPGKQKVIFPSHHPYYKLSHNTKQTITRITETELRKQRIRDMMAEMPGNLREDEMASIAVHNLEMEKVLDITKGAPMSVDAADKQHANPKYGQNKAYGINCQTCAPAYALRCRGFDITAKPNIPGSKLEYLSRGVNAYEVWKNIDGSPASYTSTLDWLTRKGYAKMTSKRYLEFFNETCNEEGIYELSIGWKGGGGHATILQRFADGELRYIEPQCDNSKGSGKEHANLEYLAKSGAANPHRCRGIMRIDNKLFNVEFASIFEK